MLGLAFLFVGITYIFLSVWVVKYALHQAEERGIAKWKWGLSAGLVMYLLLFWDHALTLAVYQYHCKKEEGFTIYKTLEELKQENPNVAEALTYGKFSKKEGISDGYIKYINQRFDLVLTTTPLFLSVKQHKHKIIDKLNNKVIAERIDFSRGWGDFPVHIDGLQSYKFWLENKSCDKDMKNRMQFNKYKKSVKKMGRG